MLNAGEMEGVALRYGFFYGPGTWYHPEGKRRSGPQAGGPRHRNRRGRLVVGLAFWSEATPRSFVPYPLALHPNPVTLAIPINFEAVAVHLGGDRIENVARRANGRRVDLDDDVIESQSEVRRPVA